MQISESGTGAGLCLDFKLFYTLNFAVLRVAELIVKSPASSSSSPVRESSSSSSAALVLKIEFASDEAANAETAIKIYVHGYTFKNKPDRTQPSQTVLFPPCLSGRIQKSATAELKYSFRMRKVFCGLRRAKAGAQAHIVPHIWNNSGPAINVTARLEWLPWVDFKPYKLAVRLSVINRAINFKVLMRLALVYRG